MLHQNHYDAFTGLGHFKKNALVRFFNRYLEHKWLDESSLFRAIDYALKEIPSFGGFILTAEIENEIVAALVVNKTGFAGIMPEYLLVLQAVKPIAKSKVIVRKLEEKAIALAQGDISFLNKERGPKELLLENMTAHAKFREITNKVENRSKASA